MFFYKKEFSELFDRLRTVENKVDVHKADDDNLKNLFLIHDKKEMEKYDKIQLSLDSLQKDRNYIVGAFVLYELMHKFGYLIT